MQNGVINPAYNDGAKLAPVDAQAPATAVAHMSRAHRLNFENLSGFTDEHPDRTAPLDRYNGISKRHVLKRKKVEKSMQGANHVDPRQESKKWAKRGDGTMLEPT